MSKRNIFTIVIIVLMATLLVVVPASAEAITETIIYRNETMTFPDIDICGAGDVMVTITFNGVWHTTEYSDDDQPEEDTFPYNWDNVRRNRKIHYFCSFNRFNKS